ncbi:hypothetical protein GCM10010405_43910 [Streptomyces macrosporus]|uniref:Pyrrolo-quinoline quinone repeat domain-containing protein n=1 Tax=Streptomyces macrosporus TaxID=44032 RepID=A0ABN3KBI9_9ACTN
MLYGRRCFVGRDDETVTALDTASGRQLWQTQVVGTRALLTEIAVTADVLYVAGAKAVTAVDVHDGRVLWSVDRDAVTDAPLWDKPVAEQRAPTLTAVDEGVVVVRLKDVCLLDGRTGSVVWRTASPEYLIGPAAVDGTLVVTTTASGCRAWHRATGEALWSQEVTLHPNNVGPAAVAQDSVYLGTGDGALVALESRTGTLLWRTSAYAPVRQRGKDIAASVMAAPVIFSGHIAYTTRFGGFACHDRRTGKQNWLKILPTRDCPPSTRLNDRTVMTADDSSLGAWDLATGEKLWKLRTSRFRISRLAVQDDLVCYATPRTVFAHHVPAPRATTDR